MPANAIPLEDDPCDVIAKAMRGLGIDQHDLAQQANIDPLSLQQLLSGAKNDQLIEQIAPLLHLSASALNNLFSYLPEIQPPDGLHQCVSPFGHVGVNAYIITQNHSAIVIDTGTQASSLNRIIESHRLTIDRILITHRHPDHTACLGSLGQAPVIYPDDLNHGDLIETPIGNITALDVSGHLTPARAYLFEGLETPVCAVGDSIFAGSMGGTSGPNNYQLAMQTARDHILTLPPHTIVCPGHGPLTTVASELQNNPFFKQ